MTQLFIVSNDRKSATAKAQMAEPTGPSEHKWNAYRDHIASLPVITLHPSLSERVVEGQELSSEEVRLEYWRNGVGGCRVISKHIYDASPEDLKYKIVAHPLEESEKAGAAWENHIKQFSKLDEYWNVLPETTRLWLSQQIDIFAGKYPAPLPSQPEATGGEEKEGGVLLTRHEVNVLVTNCGMAKSAEECRTIIDALFKTKSSITTDELISLVSENRLMNRTLCNLTGLGYDSPIKELCSAAYSIATIKDDESDIDADFIIKSIEIELNKMDKSNFGQVRKTVMGSLKTLLTRHTAAQTDAVEFAEWAFQNGYRHGEKGIWYHADETSLRWNNKKKYTTADLYTLFLQTQNK